MKMKKVVPVVCATLLAVTCAKTTPANAGYYDWIEDDAGVGISPNPAVNGAGSSYGAGTSNKTGSANNSNAYSSATASASGTGAGNAGQSALVGVRQTWKWITADPINDPGPNATAVGNYSYDGSVVAAMGGNGTGSCFVTFSVSGVVMDSIQSVANAAQNSWGPTTGTGPSQDVQGSNDPFDITIQCYVNSNASASANGTNDSGSATSGPNHIGIASFTVTPNPK